MPATHDAPPENPAAPAVPRYDRIAAWMLAAVCWWWAWNLLRSNGDLDRFLARAPFIFQQEAFRLARFDLLSPIRTALAPWAINLSQSVIGTLLFVAAIARGCGSNALSLSKWLWALASVHAAVNITLFIEQVGLPRLDPAGLYPPWIFLRRFLASCAQLLICVWVLACTRVLRRMRSAGVEDGSSPL